MKKYLYADLYELEEKHWWHIAKRETCLLLIKKCGVDLVTLLDVLEHTDDVKTLKEAHRILNNRGLLLLTIPAYQWMWSNWDVVLNHRRRYTKRQIEELLKNHGFEVVKCTYLYSFLLLPVFIVR